MAGLFGGRRGGQSNGPGLMERISMMGNALDGGPAMQDQLRAREQAMLAQQALQQRTMQEDRLRAALSPADGLMGSGTGAAPNIQQQMAALDEARLLNPEVADAFAPVVQAREREQNAGSLFGNDPKAAMLYRTGNQAFLDSLGEQYKPQVIGAGGRQSVYGEGRTVDAPSFMQFGNQVQRNDPGTGLSVTVANRAPDPVNVAPGGRLLSPETGAEIGRGADRVFSAGEGDALYTEGGQQIAENAGAPKPPSAAQTEIRGQIDTNANEVIPTLNQMKTMLQSGDVITGFGADVRLQAERAAAAAGNRDAQRRVATTEAYRNMSGRVRVGMAKTLGPNPSDADMRVLTEVTAGNIGQSADSLLTTINQGLSFAGSRQQSLQAQLDSFGGQPQAAPQAGGDRAARAREILRQRGRIQ